MSQKNSKPHAFNVELATEYGVDEAIIIAHFQYWIDYNIATKKNFKDGKTWTYQTRKDIAAHFPYYSEKQVLRITNNLVKKGVLVKRSYNKSKIDKTIWYAFKNEEMFTIAQTGSRSAQTGRPIPDTKTNTKKTTTNIQCANEANASPPLDVSEFGGGSFCDSFLSFSFDDQFLARLKKIMRNEGFTVTDVNTAADYVAESKPNDPAAYLIDALRGSYKRLKKDSDSKVLTEVKKRLEGVSVRIKEMDDSILVYPQGLASEELRKKDKNFSEKLDQLAKKLKLIEKQKNKTKTPCLKKS